MLDNLLIMWYSSAILNQEVNFMKYVGSKARLSKQLAPIIQSYIDGMGDKCNGYWEPFVGGANMIDKIKCSHKYGSDSHKYLIALLRHIQQTIDDLPDTITEDEYSAVHTNPDAYPDWYVGLVGFCASYNAKWLGGYANGVKTKIGTVRNYTDEAIQNIKKQSPALEGISFACRNYADCSADGFVIYCDPPYRNTTKYATGNFDYDKFYTWCKEMSKNNTVLISEYWMPDDGFECIWQGNLKCTLDKASRSDKVERLYLCKG